MTRRHPGGNARTPRREDGSDSSHEASPLVDTEGGRLAGGPRDQNRPHAGTDEPKRQIRSRRCIELTGDIEDRHQRHPDTAREGGDLCHRGTVARR